MIGFARPRRAHLVSCRWFWAWAAIGCALALSAVSLGVLALVPGALVAFVMSRHPVARRSRYGLLSGAGILLLYVAWGQRGGPQHLNPLPWAVAGLTLFVAGLVGQARRHRTRS